MPKFINNMRKKNLIKNIKKNNTFVDVTMLDKYSYEDIKKLEPDDYYDIYLEFILESIHLVGYRLENIDIIAKYDGQFKLKNKNDYLKLNDLLNKYDIKFIINCYTWTKLKKIINSISELSEQLILDYMQYKDEHNLEKIKKYLEDNNLNYEDFIENYSDAVIWCKIDKFTKKVNQNKELNDTIKRYLSDNKTVYQALKNSFRTIDIDTLEFDDYLSLYDLATSNVICQDFREYNQLKLKYFDTLFYQNYDPYCILELIMVKMPFTPNFYNLNSILSKYSDDMLKNFCDFSDKELEFLKIFSKVEQLKSDNNKDESIRFYEKCRQYETYFYNLDFNRLYKKIRNLYGKEIDMEMSKNEFNYKTEYIAPSNKDDLKKYDGLPIYVLDGNKFYILTHSIFANPTNISVKRAWGTKNMLNNPELWNETKDEDGVNYISTSLISDNALSPWYEGKDNTVLYGFSHIKSEIAAISGGDARTSHETGKKELNKGNDSLDTPENLVMKPIKSGTVHNEIAFARFDNNGNRIKPDYVVVFGDDISNISEVSLMHAKYHQIPILIIKPNLYIKRIFEDINNLLKEYINIDSKNVTKKQDLLEELHLKIKQYHLFKLHSAHNHSIDEEKILNFIKDEMNNISKESELINNEEQIKL